MTAATIHITDHAAQRYAERVGGTTADARQAILASTKAIEAAADFGAPTLILGNGARLVLDGRTVITVLPKWDGRPRSIQREGL